jgi:hypothetical protein
LPSAFANIRVAVDDETVASRNAVMKDIDALGNVIGEAWGEKPWREKPWREKPWREKPWREKPWREMRIERRSAPIP